MDFWIVGFRLHYGAYYAEERDGCAYMNGEIHIESKYDIEEAVAIAKKKLAVLGFPHVAIDSVNYSIDSGRSWKREYR